MNTLTRHLDFAHFENRATLGVAINTDYLHVFDFFEKFYVIGFYKLLHTAGHGLVLYAVV